jgi:hypothetical protein
VVELADAGAGVVAEVVVDIDRRLPDHTSVLADVDDVDVGVGARAGAAAETHGDVAAAGTDLHRDRSFERLLVIGSVALDTFETCGLRREPA